MKSFSGLCISREENVRTLLGAESLGLGWGAAQCWTFSVYNYELNEPLVFIFSMSEVFYYSATKRSNLPKCYWLRQQMSLSYWGSGPVPHAVPLLTQREFTHINSGLGMAPVGKVFLNTNTMNDLNSDTQYSHTKMDA